MQSMDIILKTTELSKSFKGQIAVNRISLSVQKNSVYGLLGPNGAGKSTILKMIAGIFKPTSGRIEVDGHDWSRNDLKEIGALIENPPLYDNLTAYENLKVRALALGLSDERISEVLTTVQLTNTGKKKAGQFSLGMKQRLGIALALLAQPKLLILDEPTNGLDPAGIQEMRELICSLPAEYGITVVVSSHLLSEIDQMADHVGIIRKGELVYQNTLESLHTHAKQQIALRVSHTAIALDLLRQDGICATQEDDYLLLPMVDDGYVANLCRQLVSQNISLYRIEKREKSLEDIFLSLTGKENSL